MSDTICKDGIEFKEIPNWKGYYINRSGTKVLSTKKSKKGIYVKIILRNKISPYVPFTINRQTKNIGLEYLVASTYLDNPHNHILVKRRHEAFGNHCHNLEWWSGSEQYPNMVWRKIPDKENYMVSEYGHILSLKRISPQIMKTFERSDGIKYLKLSENDEGDFNFVHDLVASAFLTEEKEDNNYVVHIGDNKYNHYSNLKWVKNLNGDLDDLEWRQLKDYPKYWISENGFIKSYVNRIPKIMKLDRNWAQVYDKNGTKYHKTIEELVASEFLENVNGYKYILHIDGDLKNYHYTNLQWCELPEIPKDDGLDWRPIKGFESYFINIKGEIKSFKKGKAYMLNPYIGLAGYPLVNLYSFEKISQTFSVHKLMGLTYIPNPENKPVIDHIDRNRTNNNLENLRWATYKENSANRDEYSGVAKEIAQIDENGNIIKTYSSAAEASRCLNVLVQDKIARCARGETETAVGYRWKYINDDDEDFYEPKDDEIFKPVVGYYKGEKIHYPNYKISNYGTLINIERRVKRKPVDNEYQIYGLSHEGTSKNFYVHVLVASFFVEGMTEDRCYVNHRDENKSNFHWTNLEWVTHQENVRYSFDRKKFGKVILEIEKTVKKVE